MKKYIYHSLLLALAALAVQACNYDKLMTFTADQQSDVYFTWLDDDKLKGEKDSTDVAFFNLSGSEYLMNIPVSVTGTFADVDRYATFAVDTGTTAEEGKHYEFPEDRITIPAGKAGGTFTIRIIRDTSLSTTEQIMRLNVKLVPSADFGTNYQSKLNLTTKKSKPVIQYRMTISDMLKIPSYWSGRPGGPAVSDFFGTYSTKKFLLICEVNQFPPAFLDGQEWNNDGTKVQLNSRNAYPTLQASARKTQIYLNQEEAAGRTVYEDDGTTKMEMGTRGKP